MIRKELNEKLKKIIEAVRNTGVKVTSVSIDADVDLANIMGDILPKIIDVELVVKIGLRLEESEEER